MTPLNSMSLYLKYRPKTFDEVVGQSHIIDIIKAQIAKHEINNNYLFFGPRGTGKTSAARLLARATNCPNMKDGNPCNECPACQSILANKNLDFVEIDAASHTQVDNIREEIIEKAPYPPSNLTKKVYIIDEVHMLSKAAFNALLKIMEEPPAYLMFILATTEISKVPETIISRCQVFNFKRLTNDEIITRLKYIADAEKFAYQDKALELIANVSDGAMRDAIKYIDQVSVLGEIDESNVSKFLGVAPDKMIKQFIDLFKNQDIDGLFAMLDDMQSQGIDLLNFAKEVLMHIDRDFKQDMDFYARLGDVFKNIIIGIKGYPMPLVIYKSSIYKFFEDKSISPHNATKNVQKPQNTQKEDLPQPQPTKPENPAPEQKSQDTPKPADISDTQQIMSKVIDLTDKGPVQTALKNFANIDEISDGIVKLIVIHKMQHSILTKPENMKILNNIFTQALGQDVGVEVIFMSKTDYMAKQLG